MKLTVISTLLIIATLASGCNEITFDKDSNKIISFADPNFKERITPYFDSNGDGFVSVYEAENGRKVPYGTAERVVMDCDNSDGAHTALFGIDEVRFFKNVHVLRFGGNNLSGTLDLKRLKSLVEIDFTDNAGIEKIILNSSVKNTGAMVINIEPGTEIEYYTDPENN